MADKRIGDYSQANEKKYQRRQRSGDTEVPQCIVPGDVDRAFIDRAEVENLEVLGVVRKNRNI